MSIAVQTTVGEIGRKALTELSFAFAGMVNCGTFQYGMNSSGIFLLNYGSTNNGSALSHSFTLATSDYGSKNKKRIRKMYMKVDVYADTNFTVEVKPEDGAWISKTVSVVGAGLKKINFTIQRENMSGTYHTIRISSASLFRIHSLHGLFVVRGLGV